jgi:hypothetical protein
MMTGQRSTSPYLDIPSALPADGWRSACGPDGGNCVEVNLVGTAGIVGIRDSKPGAGPALVFGRAGWRAFLAGTVAGSHAVHKYHA